MKKLYIPPSLIAYCFVCMAVFYFALPDFNMILFPFNFIGLMIAFSGFFLMGKARDLFKKHQTTLQIKTSNHLITEGVFAKTRNPMYLGMFILIFGFSIVSMNLISLILPFLFIIFVRFIFINKEEKLMLDQFGEEYLSYRNKVRRWI
jgi:protein-S-isoprenylcysteine O-methyltransferase Ste14